MQERERTAWLKAILIAFCLVCVLNLKTALVGAAMVIGLAIPIFMLRHAAVACWRRVRNYTERRETWNSES